MSTETSRVAQEMTAAIARHGNDDPNHKPPQPEKTGAECLKHATAYSEAIKSSMFNDRRAK